MSQQLALQHHAAPVTGDVDALAYIDELTPGQKEAAEALIDEELQTMKAEGLHAEQFTAHLRPIASFCSFRVRSTRV